MLIHTCCADCFLKFYEKLNNKQQQAVKIFFYNPNIYPREEYQARLQALKKVVKTLNYSVKIIGSDYLPQAYFRNLANFNFQQNDRKNKKKQHIFTIIPQEKRCPHCWELRLRALFAIAKVKGLDEVSSTLLSSNYQNIAQIKKIAKTLSKEYQIKFYVPQFTRSDRQQIKTGFYKQNYCGCLYSLLEKSREKYSL